MTEKVTQVGPYRVPAGVIVFPCLYSVLNCRANWERASEVRTRAESVATTGAACECAACVLRGGRQGGESRK